MVKDFITPDFLTKYDEITKRIVYAIYLSSKNPFNTYILQQKKKLKNIRKIHIFKKWKVSELKQKKMQ